MQKLKIQESLLLASNGRWNWVFRCSNTGKPDPTEEEYDAAVDGAADWLLAYSPVRGGYVGAGVAGKLGSGTYVPGFAAGGELNWTIDHGFGTELCGGLGFQMRGNHTVYPYGTRTFVSEQFGFYSGWTWNADEGSNADVGFYGGIGNINGGGVGTFNPFDGSMNFGIGYGVFGAGLKLDTSKLGNLFNFNLPDPE